MQSIAQRFRVENRRQTQFWVMVFAAILAGLSLATHLVLNYSETSLGGGAISNHIYSIELVLMCGSMLLLLKLAFDDQRAAKKKYDTALHEGVVREHQNIMKGQAKALDAHAMVSISTPTGKIIEANDNFCQFFGYDENTIASASNGDIYPGGKDNKTHKAISTAVSAGQTWQGKQSLRTLTGETVTVFTTVIPVMDDNGERTHNICIRNDVTDLERSEGHRMLSELLGELQDEVYVYNIETLDLVYANKAACDRCDWSHDEVTEKSIAASSSNFDKRMFWAYVAPLLDDTEDIVTIKTVHDKGPVEISTRKVQTQAGDEVFVSVLKDTSEQQRIEQARLESLSEASHELRSPLTSIKGSLRLLESGMIGPMPEKAQELVTVARRNTDRLIGMVNNVLDFEKLKSGTMDIEKCPIDINDVSRKSIEMMEAYTNQHKAKIELALPSQPSLVNGNEDRLTQVIVNLISNAAKHSPEDGKVVVRVANDEGRFRLSVEDEGPGVPEEARELIFESFGQADALDGIKRHGTGLGLAISQKILKMHGTELQIESEPKQGSTFFFEMPQMDATQQM